MNRILAIHHRSGSFSDRWIEYCTINSVPFKVVDCHSSNIISELRDCWGLMWHFSQTFIEDLHIAHSIIRSAEAIGVKVFPNTDTSWHFDDKVAQKYLMDALSIPSVESFVFVSRKDALRWSVETRYPKVFKLRGGAGSSNVRLVNSRSEAQRLIEQAFSRGFPAVPRLNALQERWWQFKRDRTIQALVGIFRGLFRVFWGNPRLMRLPKHQHYAYFQEFVPRNDSDIRVIVIGNRAFGIKRMVREGDFRASGSGRIVYAREAIPLRCLELSFETAEKLGTQSLALDFVFEEGVPLVVEMSYAFAVAAYRDCPGYWRRDGTWVEGAFRPEDFIIEDFISLPNGSVS